MLDAAVGTARPSAVERVQGAASSALHRVLTGPPVPARLLGRYPRALYLQVDDPTQAGVVLALVTSDALRLPCSVVLGAAGEMPHGLVRALAAPSGVSAGNGALSAAGIAVEISRWWRPRVPRVPAAAADADVASVAVGVGPAPEEVRRPLAALAEALRGLPAPAALSAAARRLVGLGPGLTPAGDDVLAGLLMTLATAGPRQRGLAAQLAASVLHDAATRTTALSATLLRCAARGEGVAEAVDLVDALRDGHGRATTAAALSRLLAVGSSSGCALAHGVLLGIGVTADRRGTELRDEEVA